MKKIAVIIPAYNEAASIGHVLEALPRFVSAVFVVNNNSSDNTAEAAKEKGATVLFEERKGYGYACLKAMEELAKNPPDIVVFLDGDFSDFPEELPLLIDPILTENKQFVLGSRVKSLREQGALTPQQIFGNALACFLMRILYKGQFTDLGPFRAIEWSVLNGLEMQDKTYGWTVEMQLKVLKRKIPYTEVTVHYRKRIGTSKVSGTLKGTLMAGYKILSWIGTFYFSKWN